MAVLHNSSVSGGFVMGVGKFGVFGVRQRDVPLGGC